MSAASHELLHDHEQPVVAEFVTEEQDAIEELAESYETGDLVLDNKDVPLPRPQFNNIVFGLKSAVENNKTDKMELDGEENIEVVKALAEAAKKSDDEKLIKDAEVLMLNDIWKLDSEDGPITQEEKQLTHRPETDAPASHTESSYDEAKKKLEIEGAVFTRSPYQKWASVNRTVEAEQARLARYAETPKVVYSTDGVEVEGEERSRRQEVADKVFAPVDALTDRLEPKLARVAEKYGQRGESDPVTIKGLGSFLTALHAAELTYGTSHALTTQNPFFEGNRRNLNTHLDAANVSGEAQKSYEYTYTGKDAKALMKAIHTAAEAAKYLEERGETVPIYLDAAAHMVESMVSVEDGYEKKLQLGVDTDEQDTKEYEVPTEEIELPEPTDIKVKREQKARNKRSYDDIAA